MKVGRNNLNRKIFALKDFRGVDYASSPLEVQPYRATDMANLLLRDGMLRKRKGLKQLFKVLGLGNVGEYEQQWVKVYAPSDDSYFVLQIVTGDKWSDSGTQSTYHVIHKGNNGFEIKQTLAATAPIGASVNIGLDMYIYGNATLSGILKYNGGEHKLEWVSDYYIPTTTINIPFMKYGEESNGNGWRVLETDPFVAFPYTSNESVNMLTNVVRNKFIARPNTFQPSEGDLGVAFFKLDGKIPTVLENGFTTGYPTPVLKIEGKNGLSPYGVFEVKKVEDLTIDLGTAIGLYDEYCWYNESAGLALCRDSRTGEIKGIGSNYSVLLKVNDTAFQTFLEAAKDTGYADDAGVKFKEFVLEYPNKNLGLTETDITTCKCATIYGVDGANDRIFLGGGSKGNMVYISENDANLQPNPTYFPADSFIVCGMSSTTVSGFMRVTDGRLAIFKDVKNYADVAVYYTNGYYAEVGTGEEGNTYQQARFTVQAGDIVRRGISARSMANLEGDNIFVSEEGVYGIQLSSNVASGERYAKERSRTINPKITKLGLSKSKGIIFEDKYFLAVDNGEVYVADARYKYTMKGDQQDTFNYEWFRLTGLYVKEWFTAGNTLYFIDKDGYICEFVESYADMYMATTSNSTLKVNEDNTATFYDKILDKVKASSYAVDDKGRKWQLQLTEDEKSIVVPEDLMDDEEDPIYAGMDLTLWFCVPISAYWQSAVLSLDNPMYRKNMWALSMTAAAEHGGMINLGYKTRLNAVNNIEIEGANASGEGDMIQFLGGTQTSLLTGASSSFGMYTFDIGGYVGINTYRRRLFERDFVHIQLLFTSETVNDCAVSELDIEYAISKKNIGVG